MTTAPSGPQVLAMLAFQHTQYPDTHLSPETLWRQTGPATRLHWHAMAADIIAGLTERGYQITRKNKEGASDGG